MVQFLKEATLGGIPFGVLEVIYPEKALWRMEDFRSTVEEHLRALREKYADYDRKALLAKTSISGFLRSSKRRTRS